MDGKYIKTTFKVVLVFFILGFIAQAVNFGIYYFTRKNYSQKDFIVKERERCEKVVNGKEGDLTDLSYCKSFLEWLKANVPQN